MSKVYGPKKSEPKEEVYYFERTYFKFGFFFSFLLVVIVLIVHIGNDDFMLFFSENTSFKLFARSFTFICREEFHAL